MKAISHLTQILKFNWQSQYNDVFFFQYRDSHYKDSTVLRPDNLYN